MRMFIMHCESDEKVIEGLKKEIQAAVEIDLFSLSVCPDDKKWFQEAKPKIKQSDLIFYVHGDKTRDSESINIGLKYAIKKKKQILLFRLNPESEKKDDITPVLRKQDEYNHTDRDLFKEISIHDLKKIMRLGYNFDIQDKLNETNDPKRDNERIEQYKAYLSTSEDVLNRRQNTSNFYTTLNTSILTLAVTIAGLLFGIASPSSRYLIIAIILFTVSVMGIVLNANWANLVESYGRLNGAKMLVIAEMEKNLPANIYDTEWKVLSERLYKGKHVSFTKIEKRLPIAFMVLFALLCIASIIFFVMYRCQ